MAITYEPQQRGLPSGSSSRDPVLAKLAATNTIDTDWPTLRHHLQLALTAALPVFQSLGPPPTAIRPSTPPVPGPSSSAITSTSSLTGKGDPALDDDAKPPPESLLLSPSQPTSAIENTTPQNPTLAEPRSVDVEPSSSPQQDRDDLRPSTQGGMVIAPFPPLDPARKRRNSLQSSAPARINGHRLPAMYEDDWDEEVVIGGKKLPGWLDEVEGKQHVEKVGKVLDDMDYAPFTIQRVAELLLDPTSRHTSLGKFLRAVEKALLVSTPWQPPSYVYIPSTTIPARTALGSSSSIPSTSSEAGSDEDTMMPPGSSTPMFSPIAFLPQGGDGSLGMDLDSGNEHHVNDRSLEDGLMSPLMLGGNTPNPHGSSGNDNFQFGPSPSIRSPTPEPDDPLSSPPSTSLSPTTITTTNATTTTGESDPGHQSYLGRVDELDTGPLSTPPQSNGTRERGKHSEHHRDEEMVTPGQGEGGNMTPHGMSDRPVPISSTTVLSEEERRIASIPRGTSLTDRFVSGQGDGDGEGKGDGRVEEAT